LNGHLALRTEIGSQFPERMMQCGHSWILPPSCAAQGNRPPVQRWDRSAQESTPTVHCARAESAAFLSGACAKTKSTIGLRRR
jgi:hypothetical protein